MDEATKATTTAKGGGSVPAYDDLPELVTPDEAGRFLRMSKNGIYDLLRRGDLPSIRFGRLIRVHKTSLLGQGRR